MEDGMREEFLKYRKESYDVLVKFKLKASNLEVTDAPQDFQIDVEQFIASVNPLRQYAEDYMKLNLPKPKDDLPNEVDIWKCILDLLDSKSRMIWDAFNHKHRMYEEGVLEIFKIRDLETLVESDVVVCCESETEAHAEIKTFIRVELEGADFRRDRILEEYASIIAFVKRNNLESVLEKDKEIPEVVVNSVFCRVPPPKEVKKLEDLQASTRDTYKNMMENLIKLSGEKDQIKKLGRNMGNLRSDIKSLIMSIVRMNLNIKFRNLKVSDDECPGRNKRDRKDDECEYYGLRRCRGFLNEAQCSEETGDAR